MVGAEREAVQNPLPRVRPSRFALRRRQILPGPLKALDRRRRRPVWAAGAGMVALSLAATWAIAAQIRTEADLAPRTAPVAAADAVDVAPSVRIVGAAQTPQTAPAIAPTPPVEPPRAASAAEPQPAASATVAPAPLAAKPVAALPAELGALPVLELDEAVFDAVEPPASEGTSRLTDRTSGRP